MDKIQLVDQNNPLMPTLYRQEGCCWRTLVAMSEYLAGHPMTVTTLIYLWTESLTSKLVDNTGFVTDVDGVLALAGKYLLSSEFPAITMLKGDVPPLQLANEVRLSSGVMYLQRKIDQTGQTHFLLYSGTMEFLFNPKPDYMIGGIESWFLYGVKNAV